ncbi:uncharacterized protein si:ch73-330k17.3 [Esox lucius]|uniref:uncharacterized protein si:ch73-330k17.3 n=1 Tax=Esox lucius TaxID=8010 RepID=UPI0014771552|nr:uncharacterized protein si:ch73-330k17.3 [Esox lucius]
MSIGLGHKRTLLLWVLAAAVTVVSGSDAPLSGPPQTLQALHCPPCERIHCTSRRALRLQCRGGLTTGVCGCCPACARTAGEGCGGAWDYLGKCDEGLVCVYQQAVLPTEGEPEERKGICKTVLETLDVESCRPECTWEYCQANPSEICSARPVSLEKQECQGSLPAHLLLKLSGLRPLCQTPAPRHVRPLTPPAVHRFGMCVQSHLNGPHQHNHICHHNLKSNAEGYLCAWCLAVQIL